MRLVQHAGVVAIGRMRARFAMATLTGLVAVSCIRQPPPVQPTARSAAEPVTPPVNDLPPSASGYSTDPAANAVTGGPLSSATEAELREALRARGDQALGDGRLAELALWALSKASPKSVPEPTMLDAMTRRLGLVGPTPQLLFFLQVPGTTPPIAEKTLQDHLGLLSANIPLTRYGIATIARGYGYDICIALEALEVELQPVPKRFARNDRFHLSATVSERFKEARLAITLPDGAVQTWKSATRRIEDEWIVVHKGIHRVEVLGDGPSGPVVVANFPIYVDVDETAVEPPGAATPAPDGVLLDAPSVESKMLALLNEARAAAKLRPIQVDDALASTARAHSVDMQEHGFFGHVSPSTGSPEDRLRAAHLLYPLYGENIARSISAEQAHQGLMDSPGHRAVLLNPDFTHVGIGAVVTTEGGLPGIFVTMDFAREMRITLEDVPRLAAETADGGRLAHFLAKLRHDAALDRAAQSAVAVLGSDPTASQRAVDTAKVQAIGAGKPAPSTCVVLIKAGDLEHLMPPPVTMDPRAETLGVAALKDPDGPETFQIVFVVQGRAKTGLACQ